MSLPQHFCWSRFGTEAGETIDKILERKELERERNHGVFLWGIGNAIGPSMRELVRKEAEPEVMFSPIRSSPRPKDVSPTDVWVWTAARDLDGSPVPLPQWSVVTSRGCPGRRTPRHYALVCYSERPLEIQTASPTIVTGSLRNLLTTNRVGASQVTAVVRYQQDVVALGASYPVAIRTRLVPPFLLELADPQPACRFARELRALG